MRVGAEDGPARYVVVGLLCADRDYLMLPQP